MHRHERSEARAESGRDPIWVPRQTVGAPFGSPLGPGAPCRWISEKIICQTTSAPAAPFGRRGAHASGFFEAHLPDLFGYRTPRANQFGCRGAPGPKYPARKAVFPLMRESGPMASRADTDELNIREQVARIDKLLAEIYAQPQISRQDKAQITQARADAGRQPEEIRFPSWQVAFVGMTAGAGCLRRAARSSKSSGFERVSCNRAASDFPLHRALSTPCQGIVERQFCQTNMGRGPRASGLSKSNLADQFGCRGTPWAHHWMPRRAVAAAGRRARPKSL
jgi:hypothetical protein